jgi:hypothetical protein
MVLKVKIQHISASNNMKMRLKKQNSGNQIKASGVRKMYDAGCTTHGNQKGVRRQASGNRMTHDTGLTMHGNPKWATVSDVR